MEEGIFEGLACLPLGVPEFFAGLLAGKEGSSLSDSSDASEREDVKPWKKGTDAGSTIISSSGAVRSSSSFFSSSDERSASGIPATDLSVAIDFFALLEDLCLLPLFFFFCFLDRWLLVGLIDGFDVWW